MTRDEAMRMAEDVQEKLKLPPLTESVYPKLAVQDRNLFADTFLEVAKQENEACELIAAISYITGQSQTALAIANRIKERRVTP